jgi:phage terminase large subunit-like protein
VIQDVGFLPVIYEALREDDWTSPEVWKKANPCLGTSISTAYLEQECRKAMELPDYENTFKRLHLNIRTEQDVRWMPLKVWDACNGAVDEAALRGESCFAALDLSSTRDITALVLLFEVGGRFKVIPYFWLPADRAAERERNDRVPYLRWAREKLMELTPGNVVDYEFIRAKVNWLAEIYQIKEIAIDPWNAQHLATELSNDGFQMVQFRQGFASMSAPSKELEKIVLAREIDHGGHPILRWMASNVCVEQDAAGNIKPSKKKSAEKIDGIVALVMALGRAIVQEMTKGSVYEGRGILTI